MESFPMFNLLYAIQLLPATHKACKTGHTGKNMMVQPDFILYYLSS